jgi:SAM-dependent methyltransferase
VRLSRKFQKLFSVDAVQSLWEHVCRLTHPVSSRRILASIDRAELERLRQHYAYRPNARRINAYEDAAYWIGINVKHVQDLWLDRAPPLHILDLGCGAGYFLYLCQLFGHEGLGLDTDDEPFFRGTTKLLGVHRIIARISSQTPLPDLGKKFDLVTGHRVCFHRIARDENGVWREWTPTDWKFFINDIRTRFLNPKGRLLLEFNPRPDSSSFFTEELRALFLSQGARIFRRKALLAADSNQRPRFRQIQKLQGSRLACHVRRPERSTYNGPFYSFQSEQFQSSICSSFAMLSAKIL